MSLIRYQYPVLNSWPSFNRLAHLSQELDRLFDGKAATQHQTSTAPNWAPPINLYEDKDAFVVTVELPGVVAEQIDLAVHDGVLTVSGERKAPEHPTLRSERPTGKFSRSLELPGRVDSTRVSATYKDGVLAVTLPKAEDAKPRRIDISLN